MKNRKNYGKFTKTDIAVAVTVWGVFIPALCAVIILAGD